jgi:hypothetical protein
MGKFKVFDTINKYIKLYEADENPAEAEGGAPAEGADAAADATDPNAAGMGGEAQAIPQEEDTVISPATKVDWARTMLAALLLPSEKADEIPDELKVPTEENADQVMKLIKGLTSLEKSLSTDDNLSGETMGNALKTV